MQVGGRADSEQQGPDAAGGIVDGTLPCSSGRPGECRDEDLRLIEASTQICPHCNGTGHVRGTESAALHVLRGVEEEAGKRRSAEVVVHVATAIALYILNHKRERLNEIERRYGMRVIIAADDSLIAPRFRIERLRTLQRAAGRRARRCAAHLAAAEQTLRRRSREFYFYVVCQRVRTKTQSRSNRAARRIARASASPDCNNVRQSSARTQSRPTNSHD